MSGWMRLVGWMGVVLLAGGVASVVLIPRWAPDSRFTDIRGPVTAAAAVGYGMVVLRLGHLAATTTGPALWVWRVGLFIAFAVPLAFVGVGTILIMGRPAQV